MGYSKSRWQKNTLSNQIRYVFNITVKGHRAWDTVLCRRSEVRRLYEEWKSRKIQELSEIQSGALFFDLIEKYLSFSKQSKSSRWYKQEVSIFKNRIKPFLGNVPVSLIKRQDIIRYIDQRIEQGVTNSTVNNDVNTISSFFSWCIKRTDSNGDRYYSNHNPCMGLRLKEKNEREIRLNEDQIVELVEKSRKYDILETAVMLSIFAGLRRGEILSLTWTDVDISNNRIILRKENTKSKRSRAIPIPQILHDFLETYDPRISQCKATIRVCPGSITIIEKRFRKLREELSFKEQLSIKQLRFHDLRHVYAQALRDAGIALSDIQAFLGHASVTTTEKRYAQSGGYDGVSKVNRLNNIINFSRLQRSGTKG